MKLSDPHTVYLSDYQPPEFFIDTVDLSLSLFADHALVTSTMSLRRSKEASEHAPLVLDGEGLSLQEVAVDGVILDPAQYEVGEQCLTLFKVPASFALRCLTVIYPQKNTALEGLYQSNGNFCTQCEAQGFRKITYYLDRPDVMARFTTTIEADTTIPVLLANGNLVEEGRVGQQRHFARWQDPFPKPCYLFAMVAGDLVAITDCFTTRSGRLVDLHIYVQAHNKERCGHAMASLQKAMRWDEEVFGLEYDLDLYMIVAVDDFNMGAMENKGLNIFNSKYVLAEPATATDDDYEGIEAVIAHEYFHNWTGNRVTCRDWFQLSLKEGLTVFRDQQFTAAMTSPAVKRINDVQMLRNVQFPEDSGPMAHPIRPDHYMEINNFYTVTIYEKGAEVIRMIHTLLGPVGFRQGMDIYFDRHDGQAVTCDDFIAAMAAGGNRDLSQFKNWYSQAGTPELQVEGHYDERQKTYTLSVEQSCPPTPGQKSKKPYHLPLKVGLLAADGTSLPMGLPAEETGAGTLKILEVRKRQQEFVFSNIPERPIPSLLGSFSAPVKLSYPYSEEELRFLMVHDPDAFNRWEAGQRLACRVLLALVADFRAGRPLVLAAEFVAVYATLLQEAGDPALLARLLVLPTEKYLGEQMAVIDVDAIFAARQFARTALAEQLFLPFRALYQAMSSDLPYCYDPALSGQRLLKNTALAYLMMTGRPEAVALCGQQFEQADNMTDALTAFRAIMHGPESSQRQAVREAFFRQWQQDSLVMDKWFSVQATAPLATTLAQVKELTCHPSFSLAQPNKVRALIGAFSTGNQVCFHESSGAGYRFLTQQVLALDRTNPQIAARLLGPLSRWHRYDAKRQILMRAELERILGQESLSTDVYEIAARSLGGA
ncbi:MAG: aminopeptidase N [Desulfurivibrionaceae bacterium]|nr:aminopeptidase N [Desulfurivibrionaceae bacterium]